MATIRKPRSGNTGHISRGDQVPATDSVPLPRGHQATRGNLIVEVTERAFVNREAAGKIIHE